MLCPRCNTELPDSAAVCSQCGSPVFAAAPTQPQVSSFSYLPSGTPPWPTTASGQLPFPLAGQTPRAYNGTPLATSDMAEEERPKRKSGSLSWPAVLLLLFATVLVGGGLSFGAVALQNRGNSPQQLPAISLTHPTQATPTPAASSTPGTVSPTPATSGNQLPTPISFQHGVSTDLGFSIQFPSGWVQDKTQQATNGNKNIVFHPSTQLPVTLFIAQISASNSAQVTSTDEINTANIQGFGTVNSLPSPQVLTNTPTTRKVGGVNWNEEDAVFATSSTNSLHVVSLAVKHNVYYYNILFFAPTSSYDEAMTKYYSKMLDSFQFTS